VEFPELQFSGDGKPSFKNLALAPQAGIQDIDTEADRWYRCRIGCELVL